MSNIWYVVFISTVVFTNAKTEVPDITLLSQADASEVNHKCIAGENVNNSAITFLGSFSNNNIPESHFIYQGKRIQETSFSCDFEDITKCSSEWNDDKFIAQSSVNEERFKDVVITDQRWEKFKTFSTSDFISLPSGNFMIGISIRSKTPALIILCPETNDELRKCYWIEISDKYVSLNECENTNINNFDKNESGCEELEKSATLIDLKKWQHFNIALIENKLQLSKQNSPSILSYGIAQTERLEKVHWLSNNNVTFCKFHKYSYLSLKDEANGQWYNIGPKLTPKHGIICVTLYVTNCSTCKVEFAIGNNEPIEPIIKKTNQDWNYLKLIKNTTENNHLQIKATKSDAGNSGFWFIDDVRQCNLNEIRVLEMTVQEKEEVSCTALTTPDYESYFGKINSGSQPICNNSSNIGRNCDISCSSIFEEGEKYIYCNNHSICLASNSKKPKCTCAAGCMGENCNISCPLGSYGYNCRKKCQPCKGHCLIYSGECPEDSECTNNMDDGCKIGLERPILINSTLTSITIKIQINQTDNPEIDIDYEIQYKAVKDVKWKIERRKQKLKHEYVTLANLVPLSSYEVRINYTNNVTLPEFFYTDCQYTNTNKYINLETDEIKSTEIKVKWKAICNGKIQLTAEPTEKKSCEIKPVSELVNITNQSHKISKLIPNTRYVLKNEYGSVIEFKTKAVPMLKSPPTVIDTTLRTITVQFKPSDVIEPDPVKKFVFQYRMRKEQKRWSKTNETTFSKDLNVYVHEIVELSAEKDYEVQVLFYNKDDNVNKDCNPTLTVKTICADLHKHKLINNLNVATSQYEATVKWKAVCNNNFEIIIQCNNKWCQKINITENVNSIAEFYSTTNLTPYTNYTLYFKTIEKEEVKIEEFRTKPAAAPKVNNLQIYSIAKDSISLRFQKPYPPYGALEYYLGQIGQCGTYNYNEKQSIDAKPCELWSNYDCIQIRNNNDTSCYEILIAAKNKDVSDDEINYEMANIETKRESDKPYNLKLNNTDICFKHPNFIRGKLKSFIITIQLNDTVLIKQNFQTITELYEVITLKKSYCHKFSGYLRSSTFKISVRTKNEESELGLPVEDFFTTEPISPLSNNDIMPIYRTNYTQKIRIPQITADTKTKNSFIFVVVCDPSSSTLKEPRKAFANEKIIPKDLQSWTNCTGKQKYWVDAILNDNITEYTIGDKNEKLRPDVNYSISVIIVNEYKHKYSYKTYSITTTAPEYSTVNPAIYSLFLLFLILPVIAYFIYRTINKPRNVQKRPEAIVKYLTENEELHTSLINKNLASSEEHSKLVKVKDLSQYVKESIENKYLAAQHAMFPKGATHEWNYGMCKENKYKNRYNNITTYDHSRVILRKLPNEPFSDFINASYIDGYKKRKAYIATQGPKPNTVNDFWRMIWQEEITCIVMLANLIENRKPKCHQYWPESDCTVEYLDVFVKVTFIEVSADYVYRFLEATYMGETRKIQHLHFISWPDHGVPLYPQSLVPFLRKILRVPTTKPIVVHCSAGVGRTGTIILVDICLRMAAKENQVDVLKYMQSIREQRANLVDNYDQYKLVHMLLLECLLAPETSLPCNNLENAVKHLINQGGLQKQMDYLKETAWHNQVMQNPLIIDEENMSKNRFTDIIPTQKQIYISRYPQNDDFSDYINAIPVDAFGIKDHFIVTQNPLPHTVKDFWRMVSEKDARVIVSLNRILINNRTNCIFWPPNKTEQYNPIPFITLTCQSIQESSAYDIYHLSLQNSKDGNEFNVRLIQCKNWEQGKLVPASTEVFLGLLEEAHSLSRPGSSVVVTCYDGATASGLFVAMYFVIEKMKLEQVCDVCQAVRAVRSNRTQFVSHIQQFEFLYQAAVDYLKAFDDYSNFELLRK